MLSYARPLAWTVGALALVLGAAAGAQDSARTLKRPQLEAYFTKPLQRTATPLKIVKVTPQQQVQVPTAAATTIQVAKSDLFFRRAADAGSVTRTPAPGGAAISPGTEPRPANTRIRIPWEFVSAKPAEPVRRFVPYLEVANGGLVYSARHRRYRGTVEVGVVDELAPDAPAQSLEQKVLIQFTLSGPGEVLPDPVVELDHTGIPYQPLTVSVTDTASLRARTRADARGVAIPLPTRPLGVRIVVQPSGTLVGLGLTRARVTVQPPPDLAAEDTLRVTLTGPFDFDRLEIAAPGGEASFRVGLPGTHEILALVNGQTVGRAPVKVDWPLAHLLVMLVGAALAGMAKLTQVEGGKTWRAALGQFGRAAPFSVIFGLGGAVGVDWFGWKLQDFGSFAPILVVAAVGGWVGSKVLDQIKK